MVGLVWGSVFKISFFSIPVIFFKFGVESAKMEVAIDLRLNLLISLYLFCVIIETELYDGLSVTCTNKFKREKMIEFEIYVSATDCIKLMFHTS